MYIVDIIIELLIRFAFGGTMGLAVGWYLSKKHDEYYKEGIDIFKRHGLELINVLEQLDQLESEIENIKEMLKDK